MEKVGDTWVDGKVPVGTKLWVAARRRKERTAYVVQASNVAFAVCTKPLNMIRRKGGGKYEHSRTVLYTVIDWRAQVRGTENLIFGFGAETKKQCEEMLKRLTEGDSEVSHRNRVPLEIVRVEFPRRKRK